MTTWVLPTLYLHPSTGFCCEQAHLSAGLQGSLLSWGTGTLWLLAHRGIQGSGYEQGL